MNKTIGGLLAFYSLLLMGSAGFIYRLAAEHTTATLVASLGGGILSLIWSARALLGSRSKALPILTLIVVCFVLLGQTVSGWMDDWTQQGARTAVLLLTGTFILSVGMLARIAYAGSFSKAPDREGVAEHAVREQAER